MALTEQQLDALVAEVLSGGQERFLEELTDSAVSRFTKAMEGLGGTQVAEAQLEQLARDWPQEARRILAEYAPVISQEVAESVQSALMASHAEDDAAMQRYIESGAAIAGASAAGAATEGFARRAAEAARGIAEIVRRQNIVMESAAEKTWYEVCDEAVNRSVLGTMREKDIIARGVARMADIGCTRIAYGKDGKQTVANFVDVAVRRHVRTQTAQAGARMTTALLDAYGHDLVITDAHWGARPEHAEWQGKPCCMKGRKKVDGMEYPDIRDLTGYGTVTGLLGANCAHSINPYYPGITPLPDHDFKKLEKRYGMTSDEYYEATQKQRVWEQRIRKTKREIAVMESAGIGLESPTYVQKRLLLGKQQASVAQLCREKNLPRQYAREKAYGVAQQPRALRSVQRNKPQLQRGSHPASQELIDEMLDTVLSGVRTTKKPVYNPRIGSPGKTTIGYNENGAKHVSRSEIGKQYAPGDKELIDTMLHEELEARIWLNVHGRERYWELNGADDDVRHAYIQKIIDRFMRLKGIR